MARQVILKPAYFLCNTECNSKMFQYSNPSQPIMSLNDLCSWYVSLSVIQKNVSQRIFLPLDIRVVLVLRLVLKWSISAFYVSIQSQD